MFQENNNLITITDYFEKKYTSLKRIGNQIHSFTSVSEEYNSLKNGVGLRLNSNNVFIEMTGKDVLDFLHRISTNSIKDIKPFEVKNTLFLNEKGRFIDRTALIRFENDFMLIGNNDEEKRLYNWINKFIIMDDITTQDVSDKYVVMGLLGKQSESFFTLLLGKEDGHFSPNFLKKYEVDGFTFHIFSNIEFNNILTYKILLEKEKCADFIEYLFTIKSVFDLSLVGDEAYNLFRIEYGLPSFPNEINDSINPYEINLVSEVNFRKGCYIGQEVIARLDTYDKVQRKMMHVTAKDLINKTTPLIVFDLNGNEAGEITSLSNPDTKQEQIGLALIRKKALADTNRFYVNGDGKKNFIVLTEIKQIT